MKDRPNRTKKGKPRIPLSCGGPSGGEGERVDVKVHGDERRPSREKRDRKSSREGWRHQSSPSPKKSGKIVAKGGQHHMGRSAECPDKESRERERARRHAEKENGGGLRANSGSQGKRGLWRGLVKGGKLLRSKRVKSLYSIGKTSQFTFF